MTKIEAKVIKHSRCPKGHELITYELVFPRFLLAELNTHRMFSKNSASCLAGDTVITIEKPSLLKKGLKSKHSNTTIKEIVDKWFNGDSSGRDMKSRISKMNLRCLNETTGEFITTNITNCFKQGLQHVYEITLENGYKLKCTDKHRIFTDEGWKTLSDIEVKNNNNLVSYNKHSFKVATNGLTVSKEWLLSEKESGKSLTTICKENNLNFKNVSSLSEKYQIRWRKPLIDNEVLSYRNIEWLTSKLKEGLFATEIANICNTTVDRVKKSIKRLGLSGNKYVWNSRKDVWNLGKTYKQKEESLKNIKAAALRRIKVDSYKHYRNYDAKQARFLNEVRKELIASNKHICVISGSSLNIQLHHIDPVWNNKDKEFDKENIIPLNREIHKWIHSNNLDLVLLNYYREGGDMSLFKDLHLGLKLKCSDINKPTGKGNLLIARYYNIKNISYIGLEETYDLEVKAPFHNFIANKIVVHNSRAIPFKKMVEMVQNDPFKPIAWQKEHKGMQGTEYFTDEVDIDKRRLQWFAAKDEAIECAKSLAAFGVTKQLCNRLLEPFMWHKVLLTTGLEGLKNFFELRCPQYELADYQDKTVIHKGKSVTEVVSKVVSYHNDDKYLEWSLDNWTYLDWANVNKGQAEIHMMELAEQMYDAYNDSVPQLLNEGEWHIPYKELIDMTSTGADFLKHLDRGLTDGELLMGYIKASTGLCARTSYITVGDEKIPSIETLIGIHDKMKDSVPFHASPFEHCSRVMTDYEYACYTKGYPDPEGGQNEKNGWCRNYRGFIQYRELIEN